MSHLSSSSTIYKILLGGVCLAGEVVVGIYIVMIIIANWVWEQQRNCLIHHKMKTIRIPGSEKTP